MNSLLTFGLFFMFLARYPNLKVLKVSASFNILGERLMIRLVLAFPPKDSWRILVSLESRYGIWPIFA